MSRSRASFIGMLLASSLFATACGPQPQPEATPTAPAETESSTSGLQCNGPGLRYVSRDPVECLSITWSCNAGEEQFLNDCGCGCRKL